MNSNYYQIYIGQKKYLNDSLKPVFALLFRKHSYIDCVILCQQEAEEIYNKLTLHPEKDIWLSTTNHLLLAGEQPPNIHDDQNYNMLIEQVRFFNGELPLLCKESQSLQWLRQDFDNKIEFLQKYLRQCRNISQNDIGLLKKSLLKTIAPVDSQLRALSLFTQRTSSNSNTPESEAKLIA